MTLMNLRETADGTLLPVKAQPAARRNELRGIRDGHLVVAVTAIAEGGKANQAIIRYLASILDIPKSGIEIVNGATSPKKTLLVRGLTAKEINSRLNAGGP
jgi:uncharacterized protein